MNPIHAIDQLLGDWASPKVRRSLHSLVALVAFGITIWQGTDGDPKKAVVAGVVALYGAANKANTLHTDLAAAGTGHQDDDDDDEDTYEAAGGADFPQSLD